MSNFFACINSHLLFNAVPDALLLVNDRGQVSQANTAAQAIFGYTESEILGMGIEELMPSRFRRRHRQFFDNFFANPKKRLIGERRGLFLLTRDSRELLVDIGLSPLILEGRLYILTSLNVADRRYQIEQALELSQERLSLAKEAAGLVVVDYDIQEEIFFVDKMFHERLQEIFGEEIEERMPYHQLIKAIHPNDLDNFQNTFQKAMGTERDARLSVEFRIISPVNKIERWIIIVGSVYFDNSGLAKRILGVARDITKRKKGEKEKLLQRAEAEIFFKQQVAFSTVSVIAHQINSPLTAISLYSEVAMREIANDSIDLAKVQHALKGCIEQAQFAGRNLHELLVFLRKGEIKDEALNINELVKDALKEANDVSLCEFLVSVDLQQNLPPVLAKRIHVQKILLNLIGNAIEAARSVGTSPIRIAIQTQSLPEKNLIEVIVQDNGPGIDEEQAKHIFEPFFTTKEKGLGVGLSICRALIESGGGRMWVEFNNRPGAKFHFTLPVAQI